MSFTRVFVAAFIGAGILWLVWARLLWPWAVLATTALGFEGWLIATGRQTISAAVRYFARQQPLVPWMFGAAFGIGIASGYVVDPYVIAALCVLQGHFFFSLDEVRA